jgi:hypothetical protein
VVNQISVDFSLLWRLTDSQLLAHFNLHYWQPPSWRMCHLSATMKSADLVLIGEVIEAEVVSSRAAAADKDWDI